MRRLLMAGVAAVVLAVGGPAHASGAPMATVVPPTSVGFAVVSGEAAGGPGGPAHDFVAACQAVLTPPQPGVLTHVWCTINGVIVASNVSPGGVAVAATTAPVTISADAFRFCVNVQLIGVPVFAAPMCADFVST